ncbi:gluconolaconase [Mycolicibacterium celeriflavum]|uniref:PQQ-dependent sugar dehydrogenase n=1 Tax=Mycolicibacterium celeriflavum TaxID=1249101 RepID=UPI0007FC888F|nr:gluconolaconase [Mycolicibacterium celeriflavum]MCV7238160.1 gluconolaconase [Mycolicibacterium celeriflavum]OBG12603.1 gluconolaconase [Mycolicibacterium celeriflavum]ORA51148.1 gluconolaconase [Mycolicibacterium celeriflavum]
MRVWLRRNAIACLAGATLMAACSTSSETSTEPSPEPSPAPTVDTSAGLAPVTVAVASPLAQSPFDEPRQAMVPAGWSMSVWARVPKARLAVWAPDGALLVSQPSTGQVLRLEPTDAEPRQSTLLENLDQPHGMAFAGDALYIAESDQIDVYDYADGAATNRRTVVANLPDAKSPDLKGAYAHALKSVAVGPDGSVYFSIGSTGNISAEDRDADPPRATIMRVPPGGGPPQPFATGVRNGTGLAIAPDGSVWTAVNNRDNVADPRTGEVVPDYVDDHPPESVARLWQGRELGWPYCNPDGGPANLPFIRDVQANPDGSRLDCASLPPVEQSLGAHAAPLGMSFTTGVLPEPYASGALIGVHGSWNREPPLAPEVAFFPWQNGSLGNQQTLVAGFQADDGSRWGRPVAAVTGPDGAVYITDDYADAIYRLAPPQR